MGHHYVPQQYLRGFECKKAPGLIWMYDKSLKEFRKVPIKAAAQRPDFYDKETERWLSSVVEGPGHAALGRLRRGEKLLPGDREALAAYVAVMLMRVPSRRHKSTGLLPQVVEDVASQVRSAIEDWAARPGSDAALVARRRAEVEDFRRRAVDNPPTEVMDQINSPRPSRDVLEAIYGMTWRVIHAEPGSPFLASDNPAFIFDAYGVGKPDSELTFPLASDLALLGSHQGPPQAILLATTRKFIAREVNRRVAAGAERFCFCCEQRGWIATLADKKRPYLSSIRW
jgi:Protein of unknown function (DUF4238)